MNENANLDASSGRNTSHIEFNGKTALLIHYEVPILSRFFSNSLNNMLVCSESKDPIEYFNMDL